MENSEVRTLLVVWQNKETRLFYHIGTLSNFDDHFEFEYTQNVNRPRKLRDALQNGYMLHPAFPQIDKKYISPQLFPAFDRRIPSADRVDYVTILNDLRLNQNADRMDILRETRGRLANDTYSFEQPLRIGVDGKIRSQFYIHGMRHRKLPGNWGDILRKNKSLRLVPEEDNTADEFAVAVYTEDIHIGYVPNFYSQAVSSLIHNGAKSQMKVVSVKEKSTPHWWVKVEFESSVPDLDVYDSEDLKTAMLAIAV
ncbi:HIRAN domain-containing protein [Bhargavaea cecembensis]|uniref:HIRAN domain-containing protein n=1 Tax=Bhargavaea cecembensis TaxID=394098 RepID=UPI00058FB859|nr:HIRAN domain-containing protein [Bhargavaea cecembensis]